MKNLFILLLLTNISFALRCQIPAGKKNKVLQGKIIIRDIFTNDTNFNKLTVSISDHSTKTYSVDIKDNLTFRFDSLTGVS